MSACVAVSDSVAPSSERAFGHGRISALDGARGIAVAAVLLFHGGYLAGGYLGVDFFFVLSGFLITSLLLSETRHTGNVGLGHFWARRARRLLPALGVLLVGVALYSTLFASRSELSQIRGDALATVLYVANWRDVFAHQSYWSIFNAPSPLTHTWSLAIEEQFYLVWPLVFVALLATCKRATPKAVLATCLALGAISTVLMILFYNPTNTNRAYYGTDTRATAILLGGALAAWLSIRGPARTRASRGALEAAGIVGVLVLAAAWARLDGQSSILYRGGFVVCGLAAAAVIAAAVHPKQGIISRALSIGPLCALGLISYGVYLYHWPIDVVLDAQRVGYSGWPLFLTRTVVTIGLAILSYFIVEQPIRKGALSSSQWRRLTPALAIVVVLAIVSSTAGAASSVATPTAFPVVAAERALKAAPAGAQRILLVGNSVALTLGPGFQSLKATPPVAVFDAGIPACYFPRDVGLPPIVFGNGGERQLVPRAPCHPHWEAKVVRIFRPDVVFWIVSDADADITYRGTRVSQCEEPYRSLYRRSLLQEIAVLGAGGAKVVITTEAYPRYAGAPPTDRQTDCVNELRRQVAAEASAQLVDLFSYVCPEGHCRITENGATLRPDGQHYEGAGAQIVAKWLLDQLRNNS